MSDQRVATPTATEGGAAAPPMTVVLTIHGIGFQVSPVEAPRGYADPLHEHLSKPEMLGDRLSRDPGRLDGPPGAVYVQSFWPPRDPNGTAEDGLKRLDEKLRTADQPFAHVALVYSHLEETTPKLGSLGELLIQAMVQHQKYARFGRLIRWAWADGAALVKTTFGAAKAADGVLPSATAGTSPSLQARRSIKQPARTRTVPVLSPQPRSNPGPFRSTLATIKAPIDTLTALENDFAAYVFRNDLRERVRGFVEDAIVRLAQREDVGAIVINAHSQGTAVAFDVLTELSDDAAKKVKHVITSGSHLRKLVRLFNWGDQIGDMSSTVDWTNFYDRLDPVADGLGPGSWLPGQHLAHVALPSTLFAGRPVRDLEVNNVENCPGKGLRAHNYWDNEKQWTPEATRILLGVAKLAATVPSGGRESTRV
jgi:hypothetical protein